MGGGVSGLSFAKKISEQGCSVLILEKEKEIGGLSRTIHHNGFRLDFCAHRFHTKNSPLLTEILSLPGLKMPKYLKKSRIYMFNKYLRYPFELQNLLRAMPLHLSFLSALSFAANLIRKRLRNKEIRSYKDWFVHFYGKRLYLTMCEPYTSKIWKTDPARISADWADQKFQAESTRKLIKRVIKKLLTLNFSSYSLEDETLAPDGGEFFHPPKGIQQIPDAFARAAKNNGAEILSCVELTSISRKAKTVSFKHDNTVRIVSYDKIVSTIPLHTFYQLQDLKDSPTEQSLSKLKYMDIIFVYVFLNRDSLSNDHWLYFPDSHIIFNRAVEFKNWSPQMCPADMTAICFDITTFEPGEFSDASDEMLAQRVIDDALKVNYLPKEDIDSYLVVRIKDAYPFYDLDYKDNLKCVVNFLEDQDTFLLGRTGIFRYNNSDNSIEMGFELANNFISNKPKKSIFDYTIKNISY